MKQRAFNKTDRSNGRHQSRHRMRASRSLFV